MNLRRAVSRLDRKQMGIGAYFTCRGRRVRRIARVFACAMALSGFTIVPAGSTPVATWWHAERLSGVPSQVSVAPAGSALVFGFPDSRGYLRVAFRPPGGLSGSPTALPGAIGYPAGAPYVVGWFPDGSSLIASPAADVLAFRSPGSHGAFGAAQNLGPGEGPAAIATGPRGVALIGLAGNLGVGIAYRSAGARGSVDMKHARYFGAGTVLGVALDPKGSAVIVWINSTTGLLEEAVRKPGAAAFGHPMGIVSKPYRAAMAVDPSGYALVTWAGPPDGPDSYPTRVNATIRAPGGSFGPVHDIGVSPNGDPLTTYPAITSTGDALVAWTRIATASQFGATIATEHRGAWSAEHGDGPLSSEMDGVASVGKTLLIAGDVQNKGNETYQAQIGIVTSSGISLIHYKTTPGGAVAMDVGQSGTAIYIYGQLAHLKTQYSLLPYEARGR